MAYAFVITALLLAVYVDRVSERRERSRRVIERARAALR